MQGIGRSEVDSWAGPWKMTRTTKADKEEERAENETGNMHVKGLFRKHGVA